MHIDHYEKAIADLPGAALTTAEEQALSEDERRQLRTKLVLTGEAVRRLMRVHNKTIKGLALEMGATQVRVRNVRADGVARAAFIKDWMEAITKPGSQP